MASNPSWQLFSIQRPTWGNTDNGRLINLSLRRPRGSDRAPGSALITVAAVLLGLLAAGLFVVSLAAQYKYLVAERHETVPSMIEAVGLDVGMAIFSLLALGLAMAGQSARVERALIVACAAGSALMNYAAANGGSPRSVAAYVVPPVFLAIVVDRVVAVVRRHVLGDTERSAWAALGRIALYGLRFLLAGPSTASGLRRQVLIMTPLPEAAKPAAIEPVPGVELEPLPDVEELPEVGEPETEPEVPERPGRRRGDSKTSRFLDLVKDRHGELAAIDPAEVSRIASSLAPEVGLHPGSARSALRPLVLAAQANGSRVNGSVS
jgi:hypothetical protein